MTKIFLTYIDFFNREDKSINGVSPEFAKDYPDFAKDNETNNGCWNCSGCSDCSDCSRCYGCSDCSRCSDCSDLVKDKQVIEIPKIENIHQKVFNAVQGADSLDMTDWHTCDTTHCRAGWVVHLAGAAGYELEKQSSTEFAAMMIYKESSPIKVSPVRFYESNEQAMEDIKRCATIEIEQAKS